MKLITTTHPLPDGRNFTTIRNPRARSGEPIVISATLDKGPCWPIESLRILLDEHQKQADEQRLVFDQKLCLPGGLWLKFAFAPGVPYVARPLVDEIKPADSRLGVIKAIKNQIASERVAAVFATLPAKAQRELAVKFLIEPPVVRRVKLVKSSKK